MMPHFHPRGKKQTSLHGLLVSAVFVIVPIIQEVYLVMYVCMYAHKMVIYVQCSAAEAKRRRCRYKTLFMRYTRFDSTQGFA